MLRSACEVNIDLFEPFGCENGTLSPKEVDRARTAISACQNACPRFLACRKETAEVIAGTTRIGVPPVSVVQAGVLFDENSKPFGHTPTPAPNAKSKSCKGKKAAPAADSGTMELDLGLEPTNPTADFVVPHVNGTQVAWVPDIDLTPPRLNYRAIYFALGPAGLEQTVTRHRLNQTRSEPIEVGDKEILEPHDEQEAVRLGVERGMPLHRIAARLRTTWHRVDRMCKELGIDPPHTR